MNPEAILECQEIAAGYGREQVLRDVTFQLPQGAFCPLIGPNGAGKSTLLRVLLGLLAPWSGRVVHRHGDAPLGYVPQGWKLDSIYPLTVMEIVLQGRFQQQGFWKRPSRADREAAREALARVHLEGVEGKNYRDLSGGMKQRALIARALATGSPVLMLDEPTSEVDKPGELEILEHLHRLNREHGTTVLLVCHAVGSVFDYSDCCILVDHGKVELFEGNLERLRGPYV